VQFAVLFVAVAAVSAGVYPVKTGGGKGASKHSKGGGHDNAEDDRFHMQSADGQYVFGHTTGTQVRKDTENHPRTARSRCVSTVKSIIDAGNIIRTR
jgi:hypothetical protein